MNQRSWYLALHTALIMGCLVACAARTAAPTTRSPTAAPQLAPTAATATPTARPAPTPLRVAWWGSQNRHELTLQVIARFEQTHPDIHIIPEYLENSRYWPALQRQIIPGNLPDVMQHDYSRMESWAAQGLLHPLTPYVQNKTIAIDSVSNDLLASGRRGEDLYGISLGTNALALMYDPALLQAAGIAAPTADWTWADFEQAAATVHQRLGIFGVERFSSMDFFRLYLREHGQTLYTSTGDALGYTDDAVVATFFQLLVTMQQNGAMSTVAVEKARDATSIETSLLVRKEAAMKFIWSNQAVSLSAAAKRPLAIVQTPQIAAGTEGIALKPSMFLSIAAASQRADAAATFINYVLNDVEANQILAAERGVPIVPAVRQAIRSSLDPMQQEVFRYIGQIEAVSAPLEPPDPLPHTTISSKVYDTLVVQVLAGSLSPTDAAMQFRQQASDLLRQHRAEE